VERQGRSACSSFSAGFRSAAPATRRSASPGIRTSRRRLHRTEAELTAQAAMAAHLALKIGYLLRFANEPVPGFKKTDNTTTASVVLRWKAAAPAPTPAP